MSWRCLEYSAFDYFAFEASFVFQFPDSGQSVNQEYPSYRISETLTVLVWYAV